MFVKIRANANENAGREAHDKYSGIMGENFDVGVVFHVPCPDGEIVKKNVKMAVLEDGKPPFVDLRQHVDASGYYGAMNFHLDKAPVPPEVLGIKIKNDVKAEVDLISGKTFHEILAFIMEDKAIKDKKILGSRGVASILSDTRGTVRIDVPPAAIGEVYEQVRDLIPMPLPVDPTIGSKIIESAELEVHFDSPDKMPKPFVNDTVFKEGKEMFVEILKGYTKNFKIIGDGKMEALGEVSDAMNPKTLHVHVFNKNLGHLSIEAHAPGLHTLAEGMSTV
jgi:hypothetical protein